MGETKGQAGAMDRKKTDEGLVPESAKDCVDRRIDDLDEMVSEATRLARSIQRQLSTLEVVVRRLRGLRRAQVSKKSGRVNYLTGNLEVDQGTLDRIPGSWRN